MNSDPDSKPFANYDGAIAKGAFVQGLGGLGKLIIPLFFIVATRLYGPTVVGLYLTAFVIIEMGISLTVTGFNNGVTMFAARWGDDPGNEHRFYQMLANSAVMTGVICAALVTGAHTLGPSVLLAKFPREEIPFAVAILSWTIPMQALTTLVVAATKASLSMKWDAIVFGFLRPLSLLGFTTAFYFASQHLEALLWGHFVSSSVTAAFSVHLFRRLFSAKKLWTSIRRLEWSRELLAFAVPQNLNMTFNTFITNVDIVMLAFFGFSPEKVAFYGMGAQVVRNIRQIKLVFSNAYGPVIARYHGRGDSAAMSRSLTKVSRWTLTLGIPAAIVVAVLRSDLLSLFHETFDEDNLFMLVLIAAPLMSLGWGMAGNVVVMTGHSAWNLINSVTVATANAVLNYFLIQSHGLLGAAVATVISAGLVTVMQIVEAKGLVGAQASFAGMFKPLAAAMPALGVFLCFEGLGFNDSLWLRLVCLTLSLLVFLGTLIALKIDPGDKEAFASIFRRSPRPEGGSKPLPCWNGPRKPN